MQSALFLIAILGCDDDGLACHEQRIEAQRYESAAACRAAIPIVLTRSADLDYPVITAECRVLMSQTRFEPKPSELARNS